MACKKTLLMIVSLLTMFFMSAAKAAILAILNTILVIVVIRSYQCRTECRTYTVYCEIEMRYKTTDIPIILE